MYKELVLILFIVSGFVKGQKLVCEKLQSYPMIGFAEYFPSQSDFFCKGDTVFLFNQMKMKMFAGDGKPIESDLSKLLTKTEKGSLLASYKYSYYFSQNRLIIRNSYNVFLFLFSGNKFIFESHIKLKQKYGKNIYLNNNILYFYGIYDHLKVDEELASGYSTYNLNTHEETVFTFPFNGIAITHFSPNKFIDFTKTGYVICDPLQYKLYIYSYSNTLKDSIILSENMFKATDPNRFNKRFNPEKMGVRVVNYLDSIRGFLDTLDRIWMVDYIDETTLFVRLTRNSMRTPDKKGQIFYDHLWTKKEDGWHLSQVKNLSDFKLDEPINKEELWPYFFPGSKYTCVNGVLIYTCWSASSNKFPQTIRQFSDMDQKNREALSLRVLQFKIR